MVSLYSVPYMKHRFEELEKESSKQPAWGIYYMLFVMFSAAMLGITLSTNLLEFYIFLELTLVPSFLLILFYGYGKRERIAFMYLIWTHVGALLFLIGSLTFGYYTGTFDIFNVHTLTFNTTLWGNAAKRRSNLCSFSHNDWAVHQNGGLRSSHLAALCPCRSSQHLFQPCCHLVS